MYYMSLHDLCSTSIPNFESRIQKCHVCAAKYPIVLLKSHAKSTLSADLHLAQCRSIHNPRISGHLLQPYNLRIKSRNPLSKQG